MTSQAARGVRAPDPIAQHQTRFARISWFAIIVSFFHMASALILFSGDSLLDQVVSGGMTLLVDLAIWSCVEYLFYCNRAGRRPHPLIWAALIIALLVSVGLNYSYLYAHRPAQLPPFAQEAIPVVFAVLIPLFIAASAVARGELEQDRAGAHQQARTQQQLADELRDAQAQAAQAARAEQAARAAEAEARQQAAQLRAELERRSGEASAATKEARAASARQIEIQIAAARYEEQARAAGAQIEAAQRAADARVEAATAPLRAEVARLEALAAQLQSQAAQQAREARAAVEQARAELEQARAQAALQPAEVARALAGEQVSARAIARALRCSDSTVRGWLKTAPAVSAAD